MNTSIDDYSSIYQQAVNAYAQQNYHHAATLVDTVVTMAPHDPNTHLLRGHVYYVLQKYDVAFLEYEKVLEITSDPEITAFAKTGLENISHYQQFSNTDTNFKESDITDDVLTNNESANFSDLVDASEFDAVAPYPDSTEEASPFGDMDISKSGFDLSTLNSSINHKSDINSDSDLSYSNPFDIPTNSTVFSYKVSDAPGNNDPFANYSEDATPNNASDDKSELELPAFWLSDIPPSNNLDTGDGNNLNTSNSSEPFDIHDEVMESNEIFNSTKNTDLNSHNHDLNGVNNNDDDVTLYIKNATPEPEIKTDTLNFTTFDSIIDAHEISANLTTETEQRRGDFSTFSIDETQDKSVFASNAASNASSFDMDDSFDFEAFESAFGSDSGAPDIEKASNNSVPSFESKSSNNNGNKNSNNIEFLEDFDAFDDLGNIPGFEMSHESTFGGSQSLHSGYENTPIKSNTTSTGTSSKLNKPEATRDSELFSITSSTDAVPIFTQSDVSRLEPQVSIEQGILAPLENASLESKQWFIAGTVGVVSAVVVAAVSFAAANLSEANQRPAINRTGWAMALAAGVVSFATTGVMGSLTFKQIRRTTKDLQSQFDKVRQGNLGVQATVYSEDEFGQLAAGFNEMTRVIFTTTNEATRKAQEQEEAKENLQRQVIRLLDDVEGAARGDLTVQAEVTADVLGAVADAFNLTIQNLRDIVQQVKVAAKEVTRGATNSETFARALSTDALRQAEELAVTLNSVQVMTDSIQRVAEAAREAETVARDASSIALKGGEAVENTVAGILEIRETVAETTRKVKRLAESSQEISKIVALISQIASRTNLLALNASIEAARAGEAGRGFAIVADEVRQLADKSAKSLKEIEQIVMQIQSETSSVMTAMEEGTQQVITGTKLAEEAKRSLDNIIQVANRIDILVRSITADTVDQTETSRAVAQVMQSVELTAQETSQEAQRVSGALQHLVGVSRDLIASVERFRVETAESR
ncbi:MAG: HAMP domain-containing protein [Calothrix sp. FI2-JRJ7]|jgi:twitching motility protein PilJ|nr:HAMP domain-containing protein [Calothrix sp. FI2-JRJ7]